MSCHIMATRDTMLLLSHLLLPVSIVASGLLGPCPFTLSMQFFEVVPLLLHPSSLLRSPLVRFRALASA